MAIIFLLGTVLTLISSPPQNKSINLPSIRSGNSGSILKPLLAVVGLAAAGIGGFIFYKKRKKSKLIDIPFDNKKEQDDNDDEKQKDEE